MEESPFLLDAPGEGDEPIYISAEGDDADNTGEDNADNPDEDGGNATSTINYGVRGSIPTEGTRPR